MVYDSRHYILTSVMSINYDWFPTGSLSTVRIHFSYRKHVPIVSKWIKGTCKAPYSAFEMLPSSSWTTLIMHSIWTTPSFYIIRKSPSALCLSLSWNIHDCIYSMHFLYHEMLKNLNFHTPYTDVYIWSYNIPSLKTQDIHVIGSKNGHVPYQKPFSSFLTPSIFDCHFNLAIWRHYYFICQPFVTYPLVYCYKYLAISWVSTFRECSSRKPVGHKFDIEEREKRILRSEIPSDKTIFQPDWKHFRTIL